MDPTRALVSLEQCFSHWRNVRSSEARRQSRWAQGNELRGVGDGRDLGMMDGVGGGQWGGKDPTLDLPVSQLKPPRPCSLALAWTL